MLIKRSDMYGILHVVKVSASTEWDVFIIPHRTHPKFSKSTGNLIFYIGRPWGK